MPTEIEAGRMTGMESEWSVPEGTRVYAVGDIHGRLDLLQQMQQLIADDAAAADRRYILVFLGDYIDRGPDSRGVIDRLRGELLPGFETHFLKGNHEALLLRFLDDGSDGARWLMNGGDATFESYGIPAAPVMDEREFPEMGRALRQRLPDSHSAFFDGLEITHREGDYLFVHAGVRPGVALEAQEERDLIWIRSEFLESDESFGFRVVHGHSIGLEPEERPNRVGIDTGAVVSDKLTCAVIEGRGLRFLQT